MLALLFLLLPRPHQEPSDPEREAARLIQQLRSDSLEEREAAARKLKDLGKIAVPLLEKAAADGDVEVSGRAKRVLAGIALRARLTSNLLRVVPGIEDRLAFSPEAEWTSVFKEAISENDGKRVYPALKREDLEILAGPAVRGAREGDSQDLNELLDAIGERGLRSAIPDLIFLVQAQTEDSVWAFQTLRELRATEAVPALISILRDSNAPHRSEALGALLEIETKGVARELRDLLKGPPKSNRLQLLEGLVYLHAGDALPELLGVLGAEEVETRARAAFALGDLNLPGSVVPLEGLLRDESIKVRESAARALAKMRVRTALPTLLELLSSPNAEIREQACCGLGDLGAKEGRPAIRGLLKDPEKGVRSMAAYTLSGLPDPEAVPDLIKSLKDSDEQVRAWSVSALRRSQATQAAQEIRELLKDESNFVREMAVWALADFGVKEAIPDIARLLDDLGLYGVHALRDLDAKEYTGAIARLIGIPGGDGQVRRAAGQTLGVMKARGEIPSIQKLLSNPDYGVRRDAALALSHVGSRDTLPAIRSLLEDDHPDVREAAVQSLDRLKDEGGDAVLIELLRDPFKRVRVAAAEAFCRRGRKEGVPTVLRDAWDLTVLNAVGQPEAWKNLTAPSKAPLSVEGTVRMILTRVGSESGLKIEWSDSDPQIATWLGMHQWSLNSVSPLEVLRDVSWDGRYTFILESARLRVVPREEAMVFWSEWWKKVQSRDR